MADSKAFVTRYRQVTTNWLTALEDLNAMREQYDALDYGNTLPPEAFEGANADITKEQLVAAVGSVEALNSTFESGHNSNMYLLKL